MNRYSIHYLVYPLLTCLLFITPALALDVNITNERTDFPIDLTQLRLLEVQKNDLSFVQVKSSPWQRYFRSSKEAFPLKLNTTYWVKFTLVNHSDLERNWILQLPLHAKELWVYIPDEQGNYIEHKVGQDLSFLSRPIKVRTLAFELPSQRNIPFDVYIKVYTQKYTDLSFIISTSEKYMEVHTKGYLFMGLIYGILFLMTLYNAVLYFSIREKIYIYYVAYTLSAILFISWKDGLAFQFLWPTLPALNAYHHSVSLFFLLTSFLLYANNLLELKKEYPILHKITYIVILINFIYFVVTVVDPSYFNPLPFIYVISYCYLLGITIFYAKQQYRITRYLLVSILCMVSALVVIKLRYLGILDWNWFFEYILNYAIVIDAIAMPLAISDKLSYLKEQKELAIENKLLEEKLKTENELIQLKNQTLEFEITQQNNQLATFATNSIQKKEFLNTLKKELENITHELPNHHALKRLIKTIDKENEEDSHWDEFQLNFDKAHHNFLTHLKEEYPALKPGDLLLCAYIKLGKANKEIAALLNITVSGVEKKRMRLKEKLSLDSETALSEFILNRK